MAILYVNAATGNNSTPKASNTSGTPWASLGRAVWGNADRASGVSGEAAAAGDTVIVAAGTYTETGSFGLGKEDPFFTPINNGSSGSPITITTDGGVVAFILTNYLGPQIGCYQRDYIVWDGFTINEADGTSESDTGPVVFWQSDHCILQNCIINGEEVAFNDNHCGVRIEECDDVLITNCSINGITDSLQVDSENSAGVMLYESTNVTLEKLTITACSNGIFVKASNVGPVIIRQNYVHDNFYGIYIAGIGTNVTPSAGLECYFNIVEDNEHSGIVLKTYDVFSPDEVTITGNTVIAPAGGVGLSLLPNGDDPTGLDNVLFYGNIVYGGANSINAADADSTIFLAETGPSGPGLTSEHNVFFGATTFSRIANTNRNFATYKTYCGMDAASPASVESDPLFTNFATGDYTLQSGSPARMALPDTLDIIVGSATMDAGARQFADNGDPIQIGFDGDADPPDPDPPTNKYRAPNVLRMRMASLGGLELLLGGLGWVIARRDALWTTQKRRSSRTRW